MESELFGYERGAFTDARQSKRGLLQVADRGTLFLDEVGLLPIPVQGKLLKVLEDPHVRPLGSTQSEPVNVWIIGATNEDLEAKVREQQFRADLFHRLAVLTFWMPPLRERRDDLDLLADHALARTCEKYGVPAQRLSLSPAAREALRAYDWPGNVRELNSVIERVVLLAPPGVVTAEALGLGATGRLSAVQGSAPGPRLPGTRSAIGWPRLSPGRAGTSRERRRSSASRATRCARGWPGWGSEPPAGRSRSPSRAWGSTHLRRRVPGSLGATCRRVARPRLSEIVQNVPGGVHPSRCCRSPSRAMIRPVDTSVRGSWRTSSARWPRSTSSS